MKPVMTLWFVTGGKWPCSGRIQSCLGRRRCSRCRGGCLLSCFLRSRLFRAWLLRRSRLLGWCGLLRRRGFLRGRSFLRGRGFLRGRSLFGRRCLLGRGRFLRRCSFLGRSRFLCRGSLLGGRRFLRWCSFFGRCGLACSFRSCHNDLLGSGYKNPVPAMPASGFTAHWSAAHLLRGYSAVASVR
jgi:hypothetical protein